MSYATEDVDTASRVCALLEADGIGCWMARQDLTAETDYAAATLEAIRVSDLVLLIFSASANTSPYVLREIERAVAYERPVLSIHTDDALPNPSIEYYLNLWQWLDAQAGVENKREEIIATVRRQLDSVPWSPQSPSLTTVADAEPAEKEEPTPLAEAAEPHRLRRRTLWIICASLLIVAAVVVTAVWVLTRGSENTWTDLSPQGRVPSPRQGQDMAYDLEAHRLFMFGGNLNGSFLNDTWAYDPAANIWTDLKPSGALPAARAGPAMAYDPGARRLILFGGESGPTNNDAGGSSNDTWVYNPATNTWALLHPAGALPAGRRGHDMAYDSSSGQLIMFGGLDSADNALNDTWAYDPVANTWKEVKPAGLLPVGRSGHAMAFEASSGRVIMFGGAVVGSTLNDIWSYGPKTNMWTELKPEGKLPSPRWFSALVDDSSSGRLIMFGGDISDDPIGLMVDTYANDTWAYDLKNSTWTELKPEGTLPVARFRHSMVYDTLTGRVIMFGGFSNTGGYEQRDTWAYAP